MKKYIFHIFAIHSYINLGQISFFPKRHLLFSMYFSIYYDWKDFSIRIYIFKKDFLNWRWRYTAAILDEMKGS